MTTNHQGRAGFTLTEIALAIAIIGVGMLAVFSLFPVGLDMSKRSVDDTRVAMFAEEVLNGVRAKVASDTNAFFATALTLPSPAANQWANGSSLTVSGTVAGVLRTNVYQQLGTNGVVEYAVRYRLRFDGVAGTPNRVYARLEVWNGQFGPTNDPSVFYTEIYRPVSIP